MVTNPQFVALATRIVKLVSFRSLVWRWHALGMLQAELDESVRIHVWHESLRQIPVGSMRAVHDHRFDIHSAVVTGIIIDTPYTVLVGSQPFAPRFATGFVETQAFAIVHAKAQGALGTEGTLIGDAYAKQQPARRFDAGSHYSVARRDFHTTRIESEVAVTVVYRCNFDDKPARILGSMKSGIVADRLTTTPGHVVVSPSARDKELPTMPKALRDVLDMASEAVRR